MCEIENSGASKAHADNVARWPSLYTVPCAIRRIGWPYECIAKDRNPDHEVWHCEAHGCWWHCEAGVQEMTAMSGSRWFSTDGRQWFASPEAAQGASGDKQATCTALDCTECGAAAGKPCEPWCIADQAVPVG
jgi:hypothetical protein